MRVPKVTTAIYLDKRVLKNDKTYPIKLRITFKRQNKLYKTPYSLSESDFEKIMSTKNPRGKLKDIKLDLADIETEARDLIDTLPAFSFELFESKYKTDYGDSADLFNQFDKYIDQLKSENRFGTAISYANARKSIKDFHGKNKLDLHLISPHFLRKYELWMVEEKKNSLTTVGIYLRNVKTLFNIAIAEKAISKDYYPFGKGKYQIPQPRNIKKALTIKELEKIYKYRTAKGSPQQMYRDLWFFSYLCNGMNMKDICLLQHKDIQGDHIYFIREKTKKTNRNSKPIDVINTKEVRAIVKRWGTTPNEKKDNYVFPFVTLDLDPLKIKTVVDQVAKQTNKYIREIAKAKGIQKPITTYWARHSHATVLKRSKVGISYIQEQLGHKSQVTTQKYLDSFEDDVKKEIAEKLLDF